MRQYLVAVVCSGSHVGIKRKDVRRGQVKGMIEVREACNKARAYQNRKVWSGEVQYRERSMATGARTFYRIKRESAGGSEKRGTGGAWISGEEMVERAVCLGI